jgi:hypothetical protein
MKLNSSEQTDQGIVCYYRISSEIVESTKPGIPAQEPDTKPPSWPIIDDSDFNLDIFWLVDEGRWMIQETLDLWKPFGNPVDNKGQTCKPHPKHRRTQDSLTAEAVKVCFPDSFTEDYEPPQQSTYPVEEERRWWVEPLAQPILGSLVKAKRFSSLSFLD